MHLGTHAPSRRAVGTLVAFVALSVGGCGRTFSTSGPYFVGRSATHYRLYAIRRDPSREGLDIALAEWKQRPDDKYAEYAVLAHTTDHTDALVDAYPGLRPRQQLAIADHLRVGGGSALLATRLMPITEAPEALDALVASVAGDDDPEVQRALLAVVEGDADRSIRSAAARGLSAASDPGVRSGMVENLDPSEDPEVVVALLGSLGKLSIGERKELYARLSRQTTPHAEVYADALFGVGRDEEGLAVAALDANPAAAARLLSGSHSLSARAVSALREVPRDAAATTLPVGEALCRNRDASAAPDLVGLLDGEVHRERARLALEDCHLRALPALRGARLGSGDPTRLALVELLGASAREFPSGRVEVPDWSTGAHQSWALVDLIDRMPGGTTDPWLRYFENQSAWLAGDRGERRTEALEASRRRIAGGPQLYLDSSVTWSGPPIEETGAAALVRALGKASGVSPSLPDEAEPPLPHALPIARATGTVTCQTGYGAVTVERSTREIARLTYQVPNPVHAELAAEYARMADTIPERNWVCDTSMRFVGNNYADGVAYYEPVTECISDLRQVPNPQKQQLGAYLETVAAFIPKEGHYAVVREDRHQPLESHCTGAVDLTLGPNVSRASLDYEGARDDRYRVTKHERIDLPESVALPEVPPKETLSRDDRRVEDLSARIDAGAAALITGPRYLALLHEVLATDPPMDTRRPLLLWTDPSLETAAGFRDRFFREVP